MTAFSKVLGCRRPPSSSTPHVLCGLIIFGITLLAWRSSLVWALGLLFFFFYTCYKGDGLSTLWDCKENGGGGWHCFFNGGVGRGMTIEKPRPDAGCRRLGMESGFGLGDGGSASCPRTIVGLLPPMFSYVRVRRAKVLLAV